MEKKQELSEIWWYLGDLEGALFKLEELEDLLLILEEGYFEKKKVDLNNFEDMYSLWREYKYHQSLLVTIERCLELYNKELSSGIYKIYDVIKDMKSKSTNDTDEQNVETYIDKIAV